MRPVESERMKKWNIYISLLIQFIDIVCSQNFKWNAVCETIGVAKHAKNVQWR